MSNLEIAKTIALNLESNGLLDNETKELSVYESVLEGLVWGLEKAEKRGALKSEEKLEIAVEALENSKCDKEEVVTTFGRTYCHSERCNKCEALKKILGE